MTHNMEAHGAVQRDRLVKTTAARLRELTKDNDHLGALRLIARTFFTRHDKRLADALDALGVLHAYQGSLDEHLSAIEHKLRGYTMNVLRENLPKHHYDIIREAL